MKSNSDHTNIRNKSTRDTQIKPVDNKDERSKAVLGKDLKFLYTNADQLVNKRKDLEMLIADDKPDVMLITEVIPKNQVNPIGEELLEIDGYKCTLNFNATDSNLGSSGIRGVAIYTKKSIKVSEKDIPMDGFRDHAWVEISLKNNKTLLCGCVYRSPSSDSDLQGCIESTEKVTKLVESAYKLNQNLLILVTSIIKV